MYMLDLRHRYNQRYNRCRFRLNFQSLIPMGNRPVGMALKGVTFALAFHLYFPYLISSVFSLFMFITQSGKEI